MTRKLSRKIILIQFAILFVKFFNSSIPFEYNSFVSDVLISEEENSFVLDDGERKFLNSGLNLTGAIKYVSDDDNLPKNFKKAKAFA